MTTHHERKFPIVLITGTPGTGKSLHALLLSQALRDSSTPLTHLNIGDIVKEKGFHEGYDDEWQSYTVDEDRLLDHLEEVVNPEEAPAETDHHDPSLFPERWIDLVVVLTCDNGVLHARLTERNYPPNKLTENITAEIMQQVLSEARESYAEEIIVVLNSNGEAAGNVNGASAPAVTATAPTAEQPGDGDGDVDENIRRLESWVGQWVQDRRDGVHGEA